MRDGIGQGAFRVDQGGKPARRFGRKHVIHPCRRIGNKAVTRVICEFRGLGLQMRALGTQRVKAAKVEMPKDVE